LPRFGFEGGAATRFLDLAVAEGASRRRCFAGVGGFLAGGAARAFLRGAPGETAFFPARAGFGGPAGALDFTPRAAFPGARAEPGVFFLGFPASATAGRGAVRAGPGRPRATWDAAAGAVGAGCAARSGEARAAMGTSERACGLPVLHQLAKSSEPWNMAPYADSARRLNARATTCLGA
jgi:hypothetical protein